MSKGVPVALAGVTRRFRGGAGIVDVTFDVTIDGCTGAFVALSGVLVLDLRPVGPGWTTAPAAGAVVTREPWGPPRK